MFQLGALSDHYGSDRAAIEAALIAHTQTWLLPEAGKISLQLAETRPSYEILEPLPGWHIAQADMTVTAVPADGAIAKHLQVRDNAPLLLMKRFGVAETARIESRESTA